MSPTSLGVTYPSRSILHWYSLCRPLHVQQALTVVFAGCSVKPVTCSVCQAKMPCPALMYVCLVCSIEGMMCARLFTKGAAEIILELCTLRVRDDSGVARLEQQEKQQLLDSFSQDGNRYGPLVMPCLPPLHSSHCFCLAAHYT